ncbi:aldo/keto reductase [Subtercola sp. YIM 133946]|uniref:aldo/keto reductase n=1 Tax=Subtercola sp. YIM 133946 TaxID=3118909 RepID=UPI002F92D35C
MNPATHRARLGLGLAAIGRPAYITEGRDTDLGAGAARSVEVMRARAHALLDEAWALGVRYVDAARSYGLAEQFLGSWLAEHPGRRADLTVGSKWGYEYLGDWQLNAETQERKQHSVRMLDRQWPETLTALGGAPDVYLIHSLTPDSPALGDAALLDRLRELASGGTRLGFSTSGPSQGAVIDAVLALPDSPFGAVQTTWNLLEPSAAPALARAHDAGWFVVIKEALANGRLTTRGAAGSSDDGDADSPAGAATAGEPDARAFAARQNRPLEALALDVAAAQPWADVVLTGAVTPAQLRENVAGLAPSAAAQDEAAAAALTGPAAAALAEPPELYWAKRGARAWR